MGVNLATPETMRTLQRALYAKAKGSPDDRFYTLYDKVYREDILAFAYRCCRTNGGAPGVDGQTFEAIEAYGVERWLGELAEDLRTKTYRPEAIRRVYLPKPNGQERPLGIATLRDRVVQTAAILVLGPIFEADLQPEQYAYRPKRSALDAVQAVERLLRSGHTEVIDADLSGYFDTIPHSELMTALARRICDRAILHLIKQGLVVPVGEDRRGGRQRTAPNKESKRGIPQGSPISPLLSNVYMRRFILGWKTLGHQQRWQAYIVNYADDYVICCRRGTAKPAMAAMRAMMAQLKLRVNEDKTHLCRLPEEHFEFLGYTLGRCYSPRTGRAYLGLRPSKASMKRIRRAIRESTARRWLGVDAEVQVRQLNRMIVGWANYFSLGTVSKAYRAVDVQARQRLRRWLCKKHKQAGRGTARYPDEYLTHQLGLVSLVQRPRNLPWAKA